jgi:serine protease SohB|tara:strand:+ start:11352 stop:12359 length:1008 start_codon:yes stop_codon:yes gene_type:complete
MMEFFLDYGLFFAKTITLVIMFVLVIGFISSLAARGQHANRLQIKNVTQRYEKTKEHVQREVLSKKAFKKIQKSQKKAAKSKKEESRQRVFVLRFVGNIKASATKYLREEVSAILSVADKNDEVVLCLENAGGLVHEHGFAASQLTRFKQHDLALTVVVDKVAASGGYMMACVADKVVAAPFSVIGSIGVIAQMPNFSRLLDKNGVDFEMIKAGENKRTITMFGKNTDEDRAKFTEQVEDTHELFKDFIHEQRAAVDLTKVATGEHWYGRRALELNLIDELMTSDDYLWQLSAVADIYEVSHIVPKSLSEKVMGSAQAAVDRVLTSAWQRSIFKA